MPTAAECVCCCEVYQTADKITETGDLCELTLRCWSWLGKSVKVVFACLCCNQDTK